LFDFFNKLEFFLISKKLTILKLLKNISSIFLYYTFQINCDAISIYSYVGVSEFSIRYYIGFGKFSMTVEN
jgi:hypothetical protein